MACIVPLPISGKLQPFKNECNKTVIARVGYTLVHGGQAGFFQTVYQPSEVQNYDLTLYANLYVEWEKDAVIE